MAKEEILGTFAVGLVTGIFVSHSGILGVVSGTVIGYMLTKHIQVDCPVSFSGVYSVAKQIFTIQP